MAKVIARIVIDSDEWDSSVSTGDERPDVVWKRVVTAHAHPFSAQEVNYGVGLVGDQYFA